MNFLVEVKMEPVFFLDPSLSLGIYQKEAAAGGTVTWAEAWTEFKEILISPQDSEDNLDCTSYCFSKIKYEYTLKTD